MNAFSETLWKHTTNCMPEHCVFYKFSYSARCTVNVRTRTMFDEAAFSLSLKPELTQLKNTI